MPLRQQTLMWNKIFGEIWRNFFLGTCVNLATAFYEKFLQDFWKIWCNVFIQQWHQFSILRDISPTANMLDWWSMQDGVPGRISVQVSTVVLVSKPWPLLSCLLHHVCSRLHMDPTRRTFTSGCSTSVDIWRWKLTITNMRRLV